MPICEIECQPAEIPVAIEIGNKALGFSLAGLEIDKLNPKDREYRIVNGRDKSIKIDLTVKGLEYGPQNGIFDPSPEKIDATTQTIANKLERPVTITTRANSAFVMREDGQEPTPQPEKVDIQIPLEQIGAPQVILTVSPKNEFGCGTGNENEPPKENHLSGICLQVEKFLTETLSLPETLKCLVTLQVALAAETDFALDVNLSRVCLDENQRGYLATSLLHLLDSNPATKTGIAAVWIRQGKPDYSVTKTPLQ